jgi:DNA-binding protein HU-beta
MNSSTYLPKRLVGDIIDSTFSAIGKAVKKGQRFAYPSFGTFIARTGRNPQAGATIKIKASKAVGFKPSPTLKKSL